MLGKTPLTGYRKIFDSGGRLCTVADEIHTIQTMKRILFQTDEIVG